MISSMEKARENRLRRFARIERFKLVKSARRDPRAWDYDRWWLVRQRPDEKTVVLGTTTGVVGDPPGLSIEEVEAILYGSDDD